MEDPGITLDVHQSKEMKFVFLSEINFRLIHAMKKTIEIDPLFVQKSTLIHLLFLHLSQKVNDHFRLKFYSTLSIQILILMLDSEDLFWFLIFSCSFFIRYLKTRMKNLHQVCNKPMVFYPVSLHPDVKVYPIVCFLTRSL